MESNFRHSALPEPPGHEEAWDDLSVYRIERREQATEPKAYTGAPDFFTGKLQSTAA